jgi:hypothetical protein
MVSCVIEFVGFEKEEKSQKLRGKNWRMILRDF